MTGPNTMLGQIPKWIITGRAANANKKITNFRNNPELGQ